MRLASRWFTAGVALGAVLLLSQHASPQNPAGPGASQAPPGGVAGAALAAQTLGALDGTVTLSSIRLTGTVTADPGSSQPETGSITLEAEGGNQSRVEYDLASGTRIELRGDSAQGAPWGAWLDAQGNAHAVALHNCWTPAAWFLPQLAAMVAAHPDQQFWQMPADASGATHLRTDRWPAKQAAPAQAFIAGLSAADLYLAPNPAPGASAGQALPATLRYTLHPDKDAGKNIAVEVRYSNYQSVSGVEVPFHIQQVLAGTVLYDIQVQNAEINPSIPDSDFAEPASVAAVYAQPPPPGGKPQAGAGGQP